MRTSLEYLKIDKKGDELEFKLVVYNPNNYDILNKRIIRQAPVVELSIRNRSETTIEVENPELVIYNQNWFYSNIKTYTSSYLASQFPMILGPGRSISINYDGNNIRRLLKRTFRESFIIQVKSTNGDNFGTIKLSGFKFENIITKRRGRSFWQRTQGCQKFDRRVFNITKKEEAIVPESVDSENIQSKEENANEVVANHVKIDTPKDIIINQVAIYEQIFEDLMNE